MMVVWIAEFALYAALVGITTRISWERPIGLVGVTLCLCLAVSEVSYFGTSFASRVTLEAIQAIVIINSARIAFAADPNRATMAIVGLSVLDLSFLVAIAAGSISGRWTGFIYGNFTNAIFALQCVAVATPGATDAVMVWRRDRASRRLVGSGNSHIDALVARIDQ